jgi:hypothetical protein
MTSAAIGNLTGAVILLVVVFTVIGALASVNWIWRRL